MNLIWHIVRKDLRRMAAPVALWCLLDVGRAVLPSLAMGHAVVDGPGFNFWETMLVVMHTMEVCLACILVAALVHEDNVTGTTAWWMTRPISGERLLAAKLTSGALLFAVLPAMALSVGWIAMGFSAQELASAILWRVVAHGLIALMALGVAALAESLAQFLFGSLLLVVTLTPVISYVEFERFFSMETPPPLAKASGREWMVCIIVMWSAVLAVNQFLTRRRQVTAVLLGVGLALILGMRVGWTGKTRPLTRLRIWSEGAPIAQSADDDAVKIALTRVDKTDADNAAKLTLQVTMADGRELPYLNVWSVRGAWLRTGKPDEWTVYNRQTEPMGRPEENAVRALTGLPSRSEGLEWRVSREAPPVFSDHPRDRPEGFHGTVRLMAMRGRLLGELPLRVGTKLQAGSSLTRVVEFEHVAEKTFVVIEERDSLPMREYWLDEGRLRGRPGEVEDAYLLLDRANRHEQLLGRGEADSLCAGGLVTGQRRLEVPDWAEGATLVKVRFEADHGVARPLVVERLPVSAEEKQP